MPVCNHCGLEKDDEEFNWRYKILGIRNPACRAVNTGLELRERAQIQYGTYLPDENTLKVDGFENDAGVLVLGQERVSGVTPILPCLLV